MKKQAKSIIILLFLLVATLIVYAIPEGPSQLDVINSTRRTVTTTSNISALAGNVTQLNISASTTSLSWQGYYGNVTGTIELDKSDGSTLYSWTVANPSGEIYATTATAVPTWGSPGATGNITCWNYTLGQSSVYPYYGEVEGWDTAESTDLDAIGSFGIGEDADDSINNTFLKTSARAFPSFFVGNQFINGTSNLDSCPSLALYNSSGQSTYGGGDPVAGSPAEGGNYQEVILIDNSQPYKLLWTAIIDFERDMLGFDGGVWDFQMIVPEDGHGSDTSTTEYNFYVELE